jgi:hypothetical protein
MARLLGLILNGLRDRLEDMLKSVRHTPSLPTATLPWDAMKLLAA